MQFRVDYETNKVYGWKLDKKGSIRMYTFDLIFKNNNPCVQYYSKKIYLTEENSDFDWEKYYGLYSN